jgi:hypothetical protein
MFARRELLEGALEAGLGEITFSVHGHTAELHDRLVGVEGAFAQTLRGLTQALADGRAIVNVDVVICKQNVRHVEALIALCMRLGVREFDLLHVQPAGRAVVEEVLYDVDEAMDSLSSVFALSRRPDLFLWTNRFPVSHLEGFEELCQDPHKLEDEVRGRAEHVEALFREGRALPCRGDRCGACFLVPLCDFLHDYAERLATADFEELLVDLSTGRPLGVPDRLGGKIERVRLRAHSVADALELEAGLPGKEICLLLEEAGGLEGLDGLEVAGLPVRRLGGESPAVLDAALALGLEVEVAPGRATEGWLAAHLEEPSLVVRLSPRDRLSSYRDEDLHPRRLGELLQSSEASVEDLPPCLAGGRPVRWTTPPLEPETTGGREGTVDLELLVRRFAASRYRAHAARCRSCSLRDGCQGWHVQRVRAFGLSSLEPV